MDGSLIEGHGRDRLVSHRINDAYDWFGARRLVGGPVGRLAGWSVNVDKHGYCGEVVIVVVLLVMMVVVMMMVNGDWSSLDDHCSTQTQGLLPPTQLIFVLSVLSCFFSPNTIDETRNGMGRDVMWNEIVVDPWFIF